MFSLYLRSLICHVSKRNSLEKGRDVFLAKALLNNTFVLDNMLKY